MYSVDQEAFDRIVARVAKSFRRDLARIMRRASCKHDFRYDAKFGGLICANCAGAGPKDITQEIEP